MLFRKMLRDIAHSGVQFGAMMVLVFLCVFIFCGISSEWIGIIQVRDEYCEETKLADAWLYSLFCDDDVADLQERRYVDAVEGRYSFSVRGDDAYSPLLYLVCPSVGSISTPLVTQGREFDTLQKGYVWLDENFAKAKALDIGDCYTMLLKGIPFTLEIAGYILSPEYQYCASETSMSPDHNKIGFAYCSADSVPIRDYYISELHSGELNVEAIALCDDLFELIQDRGNFDLAIGLPSADSVADIIAELSEKEWNDVAPYTEIIARYKEGYRSNFESSARRLFYDKDISIYSQEDMSGISQLDSVIDLHIVMSAIFPLLVLVIAIMAITSTISRLISNQRIQIGTLKAIGFRNGIIIRHYVSYITFLSVIAVIPAVILGPKTIPYLFYENMASYYSLPQWRPGWSLIFILAAVLTVFSCMTAAYINARRLLKESPAATLRQVGVKFKIKPQKTDNNKHFGLTMQWNLRDMSRRKARTFMGLMGTIGCMTLLVCALSCGDSVDNMKTWMLGEIKSYETQLVLDDNVKLEEAEQLREKYNGELIMTGSVEMKHATGRVVMPLTVSECCGLYCLTDEKGITRPIKDGEVAMTAKLAKELGIHAGDIIRWRVSPFSEWVKTDVTVINKVPIGQGLTISRDVFEELDCSFNPDYIAVNEKINNCSEDAIAEIESMEQLQNFWDDFMVSVKLMSDIMLLSAMVLAIIVLYNLGSLSFTEHEREMAILKVQGFSTRALRWLITAQNIALAVAGTVVGILPGMLFTWIMCLYCGDDFDMSVSILPTSLIISSVMTIGVSAAVSLLFTRRIKKLDMVGTLKSTE